MAAVGRPKALICPSVLGSPEPDGFQWIPIDPTLLSPFFDAISIETHGCAPELFLEGRYGQRRWNFQIFFHGASPSLSASTISRSCSIVSGFPMFFMSISNPLLQILLIASFAAFNVLLVVYVSAVNQMRPVFGLCFILQRPVIAQAVFISKHISPIALPIGHHA